MLQGVSVVMISGLSVLQVARGIREMTIKVLKRER